MNDLELFENLKETVENDPSNFQAKRELAILCLDLGFEKIALKHLNALTLMFPNDPNLHFNVGICWEKLKHPKFAIKAYERAIALKDDDPDFLFNLAIVLEELGQDDASMLNFKKVIYLENEDPNAFFYIGCLYLKRGDHQNALKCFKKSIQLNYSDYFAHFYLAQEYKAMGETALAIEEYEKVLELSSDYSWANFNLAQIYYEMGDVSRAIENLERTVEKNPKDVEAYKLLIKLLLKEKTQVHAKEYTTKALNEEIENGDIYYLSAKVDFELDDMPSYERNLKNALANYKTLSYDPKLVKKELDIWKEKR